MFNAFRKFTFLLVLIFFSVVTVTTNAQTTRSPVSVSLQTGLSLATFSSHKGIELAGADFGYQSGFNVRASVFFPFSRVLGTQLGVGWVQKGSSFRIPFVNPDLDEGLDLSELNIFSNFRTGYLQIPLLLSIKPSPIFHVLAGPVVSFPLSCSVETSVEPSVEISGLTGGRECNFDLDTDLSIMAGAGVNIPLSSSFSLSLDAVYDFSTSEIAEGFESENRGFLFMAGIRLPLDR